MGIWNPIAPTYGSDIQRYLDDAAQQDELRRRQAMLGNDPSQQNVPSTPVDTATEDSIGSHPGLRRLASTGGFPGSSTGGDELRRPITPQTAGMPPRGSVAPGTDTPPPPTLNRPDFPQDIGGFGGRFGGGGYEGIPEAAATATAAPQRRSDVSGAALQDALDNQSWDVAKGTDKAKRRSKLSRFFRATGSSLLNELESDDPHANWLGAVAQGVDEAVHPSSRAKRLENIKLAKLWQPYQQDVAMESTQAKQRKADYDAEEARMKALGEQTKTGLMVPEFQQKQLEGERKLLTSTYYDNPNIEFDPSDPKNAPVVARMQAAGVPVAKKVKGEKFQFITLPNGDLKIGNPATGEVVDKGNYAKPPTITANELPDTLFGLTDEKELTDRAAASVSKEAPGKKLKPEASAALSNYTDAQGNHPYANADGTINENAFWNDVISGNSMLKPGDVYEGDVSDYTQKLAGARNSLRLAQKSRRTEVDRFRTAITNHTPTPNAATVPVTQVVKDFNNILDIKDAKKRGKALTRYYNEVLPNIKVGG